MNIKIASLKIAAWSTIFFTLGLLKIAPAFAERMEMVTYFSTATSDFDRVNMRRGVVDTNPQAIPDAADLAGNGPGLTNGTFLIERELGLGIINPQEQLDMTGNILLSPTNVTGGNPTSGALLIRGLPNNFPYMHNTGIGNFFAGMWAGNFTMTQDATQSNTGIGNFALNSVDGGGSNVAVGTGALRFNTTGNNNTAVGSSALFANEVGIGNTAVGVGALQATTQEGTGDTALGSGNTAVGVASLPQNTTGSHNTALGENVLASNTTADNNVAIGYRALANNTTGASNIAVGYNAGRGGNNLNSNLTGSENIFIGYESGPAVDAATDPIDNAVAIGKNARVSASNSLVLGGTGADAVKVGIGMEKPDTALDLNGAVSFRGMGGNGQLPAPRASPVGQARIYFDSISKTLQISEDNDFYRVLSPKEVVRVKPDDTSLSNTTIYLGDADLSFPIRKDEMWQFEIVAFLSVHRNPDFKVKLDGPDLGAAGWIRGWGMWTRAQLGDESDKYQAVFIDSYAAELIRVGDKSMDTQVVMNGIVQNGSSSGTIIFQWAPREASPQPTVLRRGSYLKARRVS